MRVSQRVWMLYIRKHTLRVIAEKISNFDKDEWQSLEIVVKALYEKGVRWSFAQVKRAVMYCFDPRYYTRHDIKDLYKSAGFKLDYLPHVPNWWGGITEWVNEGKKLRRLNADDLKSGLDEFGVDAYKFFKTRGD